MTAATFRFWRFLPCWAGVVRTVQIGTTARPRAKIGLTRVTTGILARTTKPTSSPSLCIIQVQCTSWTNNGGLGARARPKWATSTTCQAQLCICIRNVASRGECRMKRHLPWSKPKSTPIDSLRINLRQKSVKTAHHPKKLSKGKITGWSRKERQSKIFNERDKLEVLWN